ncbi:carboxypeptidase regulatory-like domain-containing protein [Bailinhaonella thermotolerans]|uniref:Protocatechuate 3,4-dioxygenase subunit alpha n=1 Tax=Bailinhaonella thermotolerans TaxID=1070861 RepID=A0A3A4AWY2_9ACTN|nr:carboxypeptidase regulatory-like domain-containing protein [Bailinhaonella thermotolerans]RJL30343.1 protocatechuate 3,4-dioxygenase subunit alpha [Bailinhaonella thermotolerans]
MITPSQTVGPFFKFALPYDKGPHVGEGGTVRLSGTVYDGAGEPVPDALIEVNHPGGYGRCETDESGNFHFVTARPDAGHLSVIVNARGLLRHLVTRVYFPGARDELLESLGERAATLVAAGDGDDLRWDIRLQGDRETVFFRV